MTKQLDLRLCAVHLVDAHHCTDVSKFISIVLLSLSTMLRLELPHINVLSKIDLLKHREEDLLFTIDFYTRAMDLRSLIESDPARGHSRKLLRMNAALCDLVDEFALVNFQTLDIQEKASLFGVLKAVDKANGYIFASEDLEVWLDQGEDPLKVYQESERF